MTWSFWIWLAAVALLPATLWGLYRLVRWAQAMPKGAFYLLAIFPLLSLFPIPPPQYKNIEEAKQQQVKQKADSGDPPDDLAA